MTQMDSSIRAVRMGHGFAWLPAEHIRDELASGLIKPLPLREGGERVVVLYLILANPDFAGPGVRRLAAIIPRQGGDGMCRETPHRAATDLIDRRMFSGTRPKRGGLLTCAENCRMNHEKAVNHGGHGEKLEFRAFLRGHPMSDQTKNA